MMILHAILASSVWLNNCISLNPKPPLALGFVSFAHDIQHILRFSSEPSHQYLVRIDWILLQRLTGNWKHNIVYVWMTIKTDFSIVSLPALEIHFVAQLAARCLILSTTEVNKSFFLFSKCSGRPRYLPSPPSCEIPSTALTFSLVSLGVLDEKEISDLVLFIS